ncbi:hypothetical protein IWW36_004590 [Coemansia brasiliensis]|uniref:Chitin-binding type-4 domain-containing protein n=1 Tax=Coemansia brasiliensis TaxID=2650707 RepID=A0A9W8LXG6_9FUNG|nr:hypothetical protein IWW36_004590 [Coemansia brasiliensis]
MQFSNTLVAISALVASCAGHSLLSTPAPRGNVKWWGTCAAGAGCSGPCDSPKAESPFNSIYNPKTYVQRGQELEVVWNRLNHPGGFVRLAMVPFNQSDDWAAFNDNVLKYTCYETTCGPSDPNDDHFGHLNGPGSSPCKTTLTIPENIPDNTAMTLQWIWYGGGIYYGEPDTSFGEYYSCSDMIVTGGPSSNQKPEPVFKGGDVTYPNSDVCKYWGSNRVGDCNFGGRKPNPIEGDLLSQSLEPCMRGPELKGKPYGMDSGSEPSPAESSYSAPSNNDVAESSAAPEAPVVPEAPAVPESPATSGSPATSESPAAPEAPVSPVSDYTEVPEQSEIPPAEESPAAPSYSEAPEKCIPHSSQF